MTDSNQTRVNKRAELVGTECPGCSDSDYWRKEIAYWEMEGVALLNIYWLPRYTKASYNESRERLEKALEDGSAVILCSNCRDVKRQEAGLPQL